MEQIVLIGIIVLSNILCFVIGAKVGQKVVNEEPITLPNPVKAVENYKASQEYKEEQRKLDIMLENINNYDGTSLGQKDVV